MIRFEAMEQDRVAFLYELYTRSAGDARQGVPYEELINALGFDERLTKRIQCQLQREGFVELTALPQMTTVGRTVMDHTRQPHHQQTIGMTPRGMQLVEDILTNLSDTACPTSAVPQAW
jgi:hypothetical protein